MSEAYDLADRGDFEGYNSVKVMCSDVLRLIDKPWVGLTDEEIQDLSYLAQKIDEGNAEWFDRWGFARAIEAKLREKNHG